MSVLWVEITATRGSTPRDAGTAMMVTENGIKGTIGGGALEFQAIENARRMLAAGKTEKVQTLPLGPGLGQCCGGAVTLHYGKAQRATDMDHFVIDQVVRNPPHPRHLWIWGAGHVGRAVVHAAPPQAFRITWIDSSLDRFPRGAQWPDQKHFPKGPTILPAADMPLLARRAARHADHLIFTYSHDIDLALCAALLKRGVRSIGLIGSDTKWVRFSKRLRAMGLDPAPITCPIGDKSLGKRPDQIAQGVVAHLMDRQQTKATA